MARRQGMLALRRPRAYAGLATGAADALLARLRRPFAGNRPEVRRSRGEERTRVDAYWGEHTVRAPSFGSTGRSERYLEWRFEEYPLFRELTGLWGRHAGEVVLDYGCGPGNDLTGLALYSGARRIVGADVSEAALSKAADRLALHSVDPARVELVLLGDSDPTLPLEDDSVDHAISLGVIHHTSDPLAVLREIRRVLKPEGSGCLMVYNRDSVYFHLYTAYERMLVEGAFPGLDVEEAFARNTDGEECPIARAYSAPDFLSLCSDSGLRAEYAGGYLSRRELRSLEDSLDAALAEERLPEEQRSFLSSLERDESGHPHHEGRPAGVGGVYRILPS
jgi:SAM-dependent methyltransferase